MNRPGLEFLFGRLNYEKVPFPARENQLLKLDSTRELIRRIGNPHHDFKIVHIAGTKGKGSTSAMVASILKESGLRTGLYSSPHLIDLEERFVVDGLECSPAQLDELIESIIPVVEQMDHEVDSGQAKFNKPTFFEMTTAIALAHFSNQKVDWAVLEVGLGGRLDSTNICTPEVCVITSISLDHQKQLGNTLTEIAAEKAGIIKPGIPVIHAVTQPDVAEVIHEIAEKNQAETLQLNRDFFVKDYVQSPPQKTTPQSQPLESMRFCFENRNTKLDVSLQLMGMHQARNGALAIQAALLIGESDKRVNAETIAAGLAKSRIAGRLEWVSSEPPVLMDVAHNNASVQAFLDTIADRSQEFQTLIFGTSRDKDATGMLKLLVPHFKFIILTRFVDNPRATDPEDLLETVKGFLSSDPATGDHKTGEGDEPTVEIAHSPSAALQKAIEVSGLGSPICVTGSVFLAGEMMQQLAKQTGPSSKPKIQTKEGKGSAQKASAVKIVAPSRLHFGLFAFGETSDLNRKLFGGIGVMVNAPSLKLNVTKAKGFQVVVGEPLRKALNTSLSDVTDRIHDYAACWLDRCGKTELKDQGIETVHDFDCCVELLDAPPVHSGFGSGTQLGMSLAAGLNHFFGIGTCSASELSQSVNRGKRSAVGSFGFIHGGFLVDGGRKSTEQFSQLHGYCDLPDQWRWVLFRVDKSQGLSGDSENAAFGELKPVSTKTTQRLQQLTRDLIYPAALRGDFETFSDAIYQYNRTAGNCFAKVQGGPYNGAEISRLIDQLREIGVQGVGQSSWGPIVYAVCPDEDSAQNLLSEIGPKLVGNTETWIASTANHGATISVLN